MRNIMTFELKKVCPLYPMFIIIKLVLSNKLCHFDLNIMVISSVWRSW